MLERIQTWDDKVLLSLAQKRTPALNKLMVCIIQCFVKNTAHY